MANSDDFKEQYSDIRWKIFRLIVIERDGNKCTSCGGVYRLQAHHIRYSKSLKVWEYPLSFMATLCEACHVRVHDSRPVSSFVLDKTRIPKNSTTQKIFDVIVDEDSKMMELLNPLKHTKIMEKRASQHKKAVQEVEAALKYRDSILAGKNK